MTTHLTPVPADGAELLHCADCTATLMARPDTAGRQHIEHQDDGSHLYWIDDVEGENSWMTKMELHPGDESQ